MPSDALAGSAAPTPAEGSIVAGDVASDLPHGSEIIEVTADGRDKQAPWLLTIDGPLDSWMRSKTWRILHLPRESTS